MGQCLVWGSMHWMWWSTRTTPAIPGFECPGRRVGKKETAISLTNLLDLICVWGLFHPKLASMGKSAVVLSSPGVVWAVGRHIPIISAEPRRHPAQSRTAARSAYCSSICYDGDEVSRRPGCARIWNGSRLTKESSRRGGRLGTVPTKEAAKQSKAAHPPGVLSQGQANDLQGESAEGRMAADPESQGVFWGPGILFFARRQLGEEDCVPLRPPPSFRPPSLLHYALPLLQI